MTKRTVHRDAISGEFVSEETAAAKPDTTIAQTVATGRVEITPAMVEAGAKALSDWFLSGEAEEHGAELIYEAMRRLEPK